MTREVTVRIDSALMARDGSHMIVSAILPDGRVILNMETPLFGSPQALASYLADQDGGYHTILGFTGNQKIEVSDEWPAKAEAATEEDPASGVGAVATTDPNAGQDAGQGEQTPPGDTPPATTDTPPASDSAPKAIGVKDGGKGKSKGE